MQFLNTNSAHMFLSSLIITVLVIRNYALVVPFIAGLFSPGISWNSTNYTGILPTTILLHYYNVIECQFGKLYLIKNENKTICLYMEVMYIYTSEERSRAAM